MVIHFLSIVTLSPGFVEVFYDTLAFFDSIFAIPSGNNNTFTSLRFSIIFFAFLFFIFIFACKIRILIRVNQFYTDKL